MSRKLSIPDHERSKVTEKTLLHVVRQSNTIDILNYGIKDFAKDIHTDLILVSKERRRVGIHSFVLTSASLLLRNLMVDGCSSFSAPMMMKQVIHLPDFSTSTLSHLRCLLYGSTIKLTHDQIKNLANLNQLLGIQLKLSMSPATSPLVTLTESEERSVLPKQQFEQLSMGSRTKTMLGQIEITRNVKSTKTSINTPKNDSTQAYVSSNNAEEMRPEDSNVVCIATEEAQYYQTNDVLEHTDANEIVEADHLLILEEALPSDGFDQQQLESNQVDNEQQYNAAIEQIPEKDKVYLQNVELQNGYTSNEINQSQTDQNVSSQHQVWIERSPEKNSELIDKEDVSEKNGSDTIIRDVGDISENPELLQEETVKTLGSDDRNGAASSNDSEEGLPLLCWYCNKEFRSFQSLCDHINTHSGSSKFSRRHHRCPRCGEVLHSTWKLRQHLTTHHTEDNTPKGDHPYAERTSTRRSKNNMKKPKGDHGYATVNVCQKSETPNTKENEDKTVNKSPEKVAVKSEANFNGHEEEIQAKKQRLENVVCDEHSYGTKRDSSPELDEFVANEEKTDHPYSSVHGPSTNQNRNQNISNELEEKKLKDKQEKAKSKAQLKNLRRRLKKSNTFSCAKCSKSFPQKYRLNRHIREVHDKEKEYKCNICPSQFFKSSSLLRHKVSVHMDYKPYVCQMCGAAFKDTSGLKYHEEHNVCNSIRYQMKA